MLELSLEGYTDGSTYSPPSSIYAVKLVAYNKLGLVVHQLIVHILQQFLMIA